MSSQSLREIRKARGLSLGEAAARARIDTGHLSRCERGKGVLSVGALYRLAVALEADDLAALLRPHVREPAA